MSRSSRWESGCRCLCSTTRQQARARHRWLSSFGGSILQRHANCQKFIRDACKVGHAIESHRRGDASGVRLRGGVPARDTRGLCRRRRIPNAERSRKSPSLVSSPARDLVRPGHAELVLTNDRWSTFEEARANPSTSVTADSPLYAHIRTARSLGELALPADPRGRYSFSAYPHFYLQVGDTESLRNASTCYVTLSPGQLASRELVVQLAPPSPLPDGALADCRGCRDGFAEVARAGA